MDISKAKAAVVAAEAVITQLITTTATNAAKQPNDLKGIAALAKANEKLGQAVEKLDEAVERSTVKVKEDKEAKAKK